LPVLMMIIATLLMPHWLYGSFFADLRLPVALPLVLIAGTRLDVQHPKIVGCLAALALLLLGARVYAVTLTWRDADRRFAEFRAASSVIPQGARLLIAQSKIPDKDRRVEGIPLVLASLEYNNFNHVPSLAVVDRDAFIPYLFTDWTAVKPLPRNAGRYEDVSSPLSPELLVASASPEWGQLHPDIRNRAGHTPYWVGWTEKFDFVVWLDFGERSGLLSEKLRLVASGSFFAIYRIVS
jgi:hypothetical protein